MKKILLKQKNSGFTIIETLVAVAILMISIAGPLTIAEKGLTAAIYARDQVTASFLAQDAMEYIKNIRDTNMKKGDDWTQGLQSCINSGSSSNPCKIDTITGINPITSCDPVNANTCYLYMSNNGIYTTASSNNTLTKFQRSFYLEKPTVGLDNNGDEVLVRVTVQWTNGTIANVVTLDSELFNVIK